MKTDLIEKKSPVVLVVDDDNNTRMLLRFALEQEGYQVIEANNGEACLATYIHHQPDIILLDAVMPVMDGFACCTQLRTVAGDNTTPILIITVLDDQDSVERAFEVGASDYITKPIHWAVLRHRVLRLFQHSVQMRYIKSLEQQLEQSHLANHRLTRKLASYEDNSGK